MALPAAINAQERLLTLNIRDSPGIEFGEMAPGIKLWPLYLDPEHSVWVLYATYAPGTRLPKHFHTGTVHFFTIKGAWNYVEYPDDVQSAGSYLFEPAGSMHSFMVADDAKENVEGFMVINGVNVNFDDNGEYVAIEGAGSIEEVIIAAAKAQGIAIPRYIRPTGKVDFTP